MRPRRFPWFALVPWLALFTGSAPSAQAAQTFEGSGAAGTGDFHMSGPWTITWGASSEFPMLAYLEIHLYDAKTNRHLGVIAKDADVRSGQKIIRAGGDYRISTVGYGTDRWVRVDEGGQAVADLLAEKPNLTEVEIVAPDAGVARSVVDHLRSWSAESDDALVLRTDDGRALSLSFYGRSDCTGLTATQNIYFVTAGLGTDVFNAILLENGKRCYIGGVAPLPTARDTR